MAKPEVLEIDGKVIPSKYEVCGRCDGKGVHDHPAFSNGITADEWNGPDWDDESREMYVKGGYDVTCSACDGKRVVLVPDLERCSAEERELLEADAEAKRDLAVCERSERFLTGGN